MNLQSGKTTRMQASPEASASPVDRVLGTELTPGNIYKKLSMVMETPKKLVNMKGPVPTTTQYIDSKASSQRSQQGSLDQEGASPFEERYDQREDKVDFVMKNCDLSPDYEVDEEPTTSHRKLMQPTFPMTLEEDKSRRTVKMSRNGGNASQVTLSAMGDDSAKAHYKSFTQSNLYKKIGTPTRKDSSRCRRVKKSPRKHSTFKVTKIKKSRVSPAFDKDSSQQNERMMMSRIKEETETFRETVQQVTCESSVRPSDYFEESPNVPLS